MKKLAIALSIFAAAASAQAECSITTTSSNEDVFIALRLHGWNFDQYDMLCDRLKKADAQLIITGSAGVMRRAAVSWASVGLKDSKTGVTSFSFGGRSTITNDAPENINRDYALQLLGESVNSAADSLAKTIDEALAALDVERKKTAAHYQRKAGSSSRK